MASYTYDHDDAGNRTTANSGSFTYNNADQLMTAGVNHDGNGNMTAGGAHGYTSSFSRTLGLDRHERCLR